MSARFKPDPAGDRLDPDRLPAGAKLFGRLGDTGARVRRPAARPGQDDRVAVFVIGHVTKEGIDRRAARAGAYRRYGVYLEGDRYQSYRLLRSVKNRFGATSRWVCLRCASTAWSKCPTHRKLFLAERMVNVPGSAIAVTMEGTRPLLVEVQGLTSQTTLGNPRRTPNGIDMNRCCC
jgi:DNA repair protein RadA/Sms